MWNRDTSCEIITFKFHASLQNHLYHSPLKAFNHDVLLNNKLLPWSIITADDVDETHFRNKSSTNTTINNTKNIEKRKLKQATQMWDKGWKLVLHINQNMKQALHQQGGDVNRCPSKHISTGFGFYDSLQKNLFTLFRWSHNPL